MTFDNSELRALATDLGSVGASLIPNVESVMRTGAGNVRDQWRRNVSGSRTLKHYPRTITAERGRTLTGIEYEVGPERGGQGSLGHLAEYGSSTHPPFKPGAKAAIDTEGPRIENALADLMGRLLA